MAAVASRWAVVFRTCKHSPWKTHRDTFLSRPKAVEAARKMQKANVYQVVVHWLDLSEPFGEEDVIHG